MRRWLRSVRPRASHRLPDLQRGEQRMELRDDLGQFRTYLRQQNLPVTQQRLAIAGVIFASDRHLSV